MDKELEKLENKLAESSLYFKELIRKKREFAKNHPILLKLRNLYYSIKRGYITFIDFFLYDIKAGCQRVKYGIAQRDVWEFDYYLTKIIVRGLKQLKKDSHGYPSEETMTMEKWREILQKIIDCFELKMMSEYTHTKEEKRVIDDGMRLFVKYYDNLWD